MEFEDVMSVAERLGITTRTVQKWCKDGKIEGAKKVGRDWWIPENFRREPVDVLPRGEEAPEIAPMKILDEIPFKLTNGDFPLGEALRYVNSIENEDMKNITYGEYYYYIGEYEKASQYLEPYLDHKNFIYRRSAALFCAFANLSKSYKHMMDFSLSILKDQIESDLTDTVSNEVMAVNVFVSAIFSTQFQLHIKDIPPLENYVRYLPEGLKYFACYLMAYKFYLEKDYSRSLGIANTALGLSFEESHPIPSTYLHIIAAVDLINLLKPEEAKMRIEKAWNYAKADGFILPFVEHHGILQGLIESYFKKDHPEDFQKIIAATKNYNAGWYRVHKEQTGRNIANNLTTTEFIIAMLYNRGWRIKEIANHIELSERTVKNYLQIVYEKLCINGKRDLEKYMMK